MLLAMREAAAFVRRLRDAYNRGEAHPYVLVPEYHKDGHVHVHVLVPFYVPKALVRRLWGHGHVDLRKWRAAERGAGGREAARRAAQYAAKYVGKTFDIEGQVLNGRHRYEVAEGFQPAVVKRAGFRSTAEALGFVLDHGEAVVFAVASEDLEDYEGPPWLWVVLERVATA